jgi:TonB-linked SusC/RagA family outer membrane protein
MKKISFFVTTALLFCGLLLHAQQATTGTIIDADGTPIPGATVMISGTSEGTTTDFDGNFSISAETGAVLEFSSIGFETQMVTLSGQSNLTIALQDSVSQLDEIIVTGYGKQARGKLTGSVATVNVKDAVKVPVVNAAEILQGRVSGVTVVSNGQPGSAPSVRIRGYGTPNSNDPLYIIDGVQTNDAFVLNSINPSDIEQINVLKDGAAAVYGARASNGVVVITTKSGRGTQGTKVSLEISTGMSVASNLPDLLNAQQLGDVLFQSKRNDGNASPSHPQYGSGASAVVPGSLIGAPQPTTVNPNGTDWLGAIFQSAPTQQLSLSVANGTEDSSSLFSLSYLKREGVQIETGYERVGLRANSEYKVGSIWTVGQHANVTLDEERGGNQIQAALRSSPLIPLRDDNGAFAGIYSTSLGIGNVNTPYATLIRGKDDYNKSLRVIADIYLQAQITKDLSFKSSFGGQNRYFNRRSYSPSTPEAETGGSQTLNEQGFNQYEWVWTNTLNYNTTFGSDHSLDAFVGYEANKQFYKGNQITRATFLFETPDYYTLATGTGTPIVVPGGTQANSNSLVSAFASANYSYKDKYLLSTTLRKDETSRFSPENQGKLFTSASIGWVIDKESFFNSSVIDNLKLRASYGELGNQELPASNPDVNISGLNEDQSFYSFTGARGSVTPGAILLSVGNQNLTWETSVSKNIGLDFGLLSGRIRGSIEYFDISTKDLIVRDNSLISSTAIDAGAPFVNFGEVNNKGVDFDIVYADETNSGFNYEVAFNLSSYKNTVVSLVGDTPIAGNSSYRGGAVTRSEVGQPISSFYGRQVTGIQQTGADAGRLQYAEIDGVAGINDGDRTVIGSPHPDFTYGININMEYKNFDLMMFWNGSQGNDIYNYSKIFTDFPTFFNGNRSTRVLDAWTPANGSNTQPALSESITNSETQPNSFFVEDGSYLRLKTLQLGYTFSDVKIKNAGVDSIRLYLSGANLLTFTDYDGLDPEVASNSALTIGVDEGTYPLPRITTVGLNINF